MTSVLVESDVQQKLAILSDEASDEVTSTPTAAQLQHATSFVYNAKRERGGTIPLFKVLQTNACRFACR